MTAIPTMEYVANAWEAYYTGDVQAATCDIESVIKTTEKMVHGDVCLVGEHRWLERVPGSITRAFREKVKRTAGPGRACLQVWSEVCIAIVIKRTQKKRVVEVMRTMTQGTLQRASALLQASAGGTGREYRLHRALQWNGAGAARRLDPQMSPCGSSPRWARTRDVLDWLHLQPVLAAS